MYNDGGTVVEFVVPVRHSDRDELARI